MKTKWRRRCMCSRTPPPASGCCLTPWKAPTATSGGICSRYARDTTSVHRGRYGGGDLHKVRAACARREQRVAALEVEIAKLKRELEDRETIRPWWEQIAGGPPLYLAFIDAYPF